MTKNEASFKDDTIMIKIEEHKGTEILSLTVWKEDMVMGQF